MSIGELLTLACTITHVAESGAADEYGNPTDETTTSATVCYLEQTARSEQTAGGDVQREDWLMFLPAGTTVSGSDRVDVAGYGLFELDGPPWPVRNPREGVTHHVECRVRRVI